MLTSFFIISVLAMARCDNTDLPSIVNGNLTKVLWKHAVNNYDLLKTALHSKVMMLEADIGMGKIIGKEMEDIPIMCHPPNTTSDLSLQWFLANVTEHNKNKPARERKGVKLDFKSIEAFEKSIDIINQTYSKANFPIWINADILPGPYNATATVVDPTRFLSGCKHFANATISVGWTTLYNDTMKDKGYNKTHIDNMLHILDTNNIKQNVTFAVRAVYASNSINLMKHLIKRDKSTLTIWSGKNDTVNVDKLRDLIVEIKVDKTYLDVPADVLNRLNLPSGKSSGNNLRNIGLFTIFIALCAYIFGTNMY